ncbi:hypothetical protein [Paludisphaera rhizosphaerae]|uniref:hypothetical protein n=1 Tax=Paludisphaera rhizosphaerae TaxID=2711216 RepID=UPI0013EAB42E|nr:hypothetical protein [Paludisphaera rhizosphaerae]
MSSHPIECSPGPATPARVLVVDDRPDEQNGAIRFAEGVDARVEHPDSVDLEMLEDVDLVLVDYDISDWPGRSKVTEISLQPINGMALAAVLREHANRLNRPTGFAIHTGEARMFSLTPAEPRAHLLARTHNLEWVFIKGNPSAVGPQVASLANAIRSLPESWPYEDRGAIEIEVRKLLALPDPESDDTPGWINAAIRDVAQCRPPVSEVAHRNHGLLFVRWVLHRILPYPCFLFDTHHLAVRLRVTHASLVAAMKGDLGQFFEPAAYQGVLRGFLGKRWWRAGIESLLWELGGSTTAKRLLAQLPANAGLPLRPLDLVDPVVCIDQDYATMDEPCGGGDVVRIVPDDWPSYAGQAWTTVALARRFPRMAAIVAEADSDRLMTTPEG